jgi:hypothetical protein
MGEFTAIGMRAAVKDPSALVINTCSQNDTAEAGDDTRWSWSNPTNRRFPVEVRGIRAVSVEALWQGTKLHGGRTEPDPVTLGGEWRRGKGKRPTGAWVGADRPPVTTPGEARRLLYIPAYAEQISRWTREPEVAARIQAARDHDGPVFLRDHDTGRGVDRNGPMSHAWLLSVFLNHGEWPGTESNGTPTLW